MPAKSRGLCAIAQYTIVIYGAQQPSVAGWGSGPTIRTDQRLCRGLRSSPARAFARVIVRTMDESLRMGFLLDRRWHWLREGIEHSKEPDRSLPVGIRSRKDLPREALIAAGFRETARHEHSDNWVGPDGTPVQFTDDPALLGPVSRAIVVQIGTLGVRVLSVADLLHEKLRAGRDPARRRSKRLQDLADTQSLLEQDPTLAAELAADEKALLEGLPP